MSTPTQPSTESAWKGSTVVGVKAPAVGAEAISRGKHAGHKLTKAGSVVLGPGEGGNAANQAGVMEIWYCHTDHTIITDWQN